MIAYIVRSSKRVFNCLTLTDFKEVEATALAMLIKGTEHIVVGDQVEIETKDQKNYEIVKVYPRKNEIFRKIVRENKKKVIASNVDLMVIMTSASLPEYKPGLVDRYLVRATQWNVKPVVLINKWDEKNPDYDWAFEEEKFKRLGISYYFLSATKSTDTELKNFHDLLKDKITIFVGQSGVGKSKLITRLNGKGVELKSAELGKVGKGAHTTTWAEMLKCQDFYLIDSPGVRTLAIDDVDEDDLINAFHDLHDYLRQCKFSNCLHEENSKGCGFQNCTDEIELARLESFRKLRLEIKSIPEWEKK